MFCSHKVIIWLKSSCDIRTLESKTVIYTAFMVMVWTVDIADHLYFMASWAFCKMSPIVLLRRKKLYRF